MKEMKEKREEREGEGGKRRRNNDSEKRNNIYMSKGKKCTVGRKENEVRVIAFYFLIKYLKITYKRNGKRYPENL